MTLMNNYLDFIERLFLLRLSNQINVLIANAPATFCLVKNLLGAGAIPGVIYYTVMIMIAVMLQ